MNYYRYFSHFPWFWSKWTHFLCKKVCDFIISMVPESGTLRKWWILTIWTHFLWKKCVVLTFPINLAGVLASETRITSFIYKTEVVLENIFFRISSFIYELRRVLRRRLYATQNFGRWRLWGGRNRGWRRNLDIPIGFQRFRDIPRPPLSPLETSSSFVLYLFVSFKGLGAAVKWEERKRS